jgi:D-3-phosphoglycerate dehydrogenase
VDIDTLSRESDVISVHCSLTPETRGMFDAARFEMMKRDSVIVNCARGPIINQEDLVTALRNGIIGAAALDVFETEPPPKENPLFFLENAVVTPHLAGSTFLAHNRVFQTSAENILRAMRGERPIPGTLLNPEVYENGAEAGSG